MSLVLALAISLLAGAPAKTGHFQLTFTERSPLTSMEELKRRDSLDRRRWPEGASWRKKQPGDYDLAAVPFEIFVSPNYKPAQAHGIFVWAGVTEFSPEWFDVLARRRLIFISHHDKNVGVVDAIHNLKKLYNIDDNRVYVAGFSDGARSAAAYIRLFPEVFHGALFLMGGSEFYETYGKKMLLTVENPGSGWQGPLDQIKKDVRLILTRGERDTFIPAEGQLQLEGLALDGFERITLIVFPNIGHQHPSAQWFEKAVAALDEVKPIKRPTTSPTKNRPLPGQIAQAQRLLNTAQFWHETSWPGKPGPRETRRYLQQILDDYPTTPSAAKAREMLLKLDQPSTKPTH